MDRLVEFFRSKSFAVLLFHLGVLLFSWPLLTLASEDGGIAVFYYIIIAWLAVVCLLACVGYSINRTHREDRE